MDKLNQYKILLVDDRLENLISLSAVLKKAGYSSDRAVSGKEALKLLLKNKYGLIILDVQMPEMSGFEVAEFIKGNSKTKNIPLIFLSADATHKEFFNKGYEVGALDYLAKPVDVNLLLLKVKNFLFLHHSLTLLEKANLNLEKKVVEAQISYEHLYYSLPQEVFLINPEGIVVNINRTGMLICGMHAKDLLHKHFERSPVLSEILSEIDKGYNFIHFFDENAPKKSVEFKIENTDNSVFYGEATITPTFNNGNLHIQVLINDITERVKFEETIRESEAFNRGILSSLSSYIAVIDRNGFIISLNESWKKAAMQIDAGTLFKAFSGENYFELCEKSMNEGNSFAEKVLSGLKSVLNKDMIRFEIEYPCHTNEEKRWFVVSASGFEGDNQKAVLRFVDITERKRSEFALIESKKLVQSIYDASPEAVIIVDGEGVITKWDAKSEALFGWKESDVLGINLSETIMPQRYREMYFNGLKHYTDFIEGPLFKKPLETTALNKNGVEFYILLNITASLINGERYFIGFIRDISERKKAEQLLFDSQRLYKNLLDNMNDGFVVDDIEGKLTFANERFCEIFGITNTDVKNIVLEDYIDPEYRTALRDRHDRRVSGEQVRDAFEFKGLRADGTSIWLEVRVNPIIEKGIIKGTQSVIRDITKKKKAEEILVESELKIRSFANHLNQVLEDERTNLAREIHDELGQQLAGIKYGISSFKKMAVNNSELENKINNLLNDVDITIQDLRKIATELRPGILDTLGLSSSIEWLVKGYEKKKGIRCNLNLDVNDKQFDKSISTCFFRICQESLTNISKHADADEISIQLFLNDSKLVLIVKDNGKGMTINKQKNPFSMGLIGMKERVNNLGGNFEIESELGKGTLIKTEVIIN